MLVFGYAVSHITTVISFPFLHDIKLWMRSVHELLDIYIDNFKDPTILGERRNRLINGELLWLLQQFTLYE